SCDAGRAGTRRGRRRRGLWRGAARSCASRRRRAWIQTADEAHQVLGTGDIGDAADGVEIGLRGNRPADDEAIAQAADLHRREVLEELLEIGLLLHLLARADAQLDLVALDAFLIPDDQLGLALALAEEHQLAAAGLDAEVGDVRVQHLDVADRVPGREGLLL